MLSRKELTDALKFRGRDQEDLFLQARNAREQLWNSSIFLRGVIEVTNKCRVDCEYCPMRRSNLKESEHFFLDEKLILRTAKSIRDRGINIVFLQGGEVPQTTKLVEGVIPRIKELFDGQVEILLCLGNKRDEEYRRMKEAGADSYILKHETSDPDLHFKLRGETFQDRIDHLRRLQDFGYKVGTGTIVGLPGQSLESVGDDILLALGMNVDMASASPFIPAEETPLSAAPYGDLDTTLNAIALMRILNPGWLIPSVSAMNKLADDGQLRGVQAGANVLTANFTPESQRSIYPIYGKSRHVATLARLNAILNQLGLRKRESCWA